MRAGRRGPLLLAAVAALVLAGAAPAAKRVRPGTVVRWPAAGVESCRLGERRFEPVGDACLYPVDLLHRTGPLHLTRVRNGRTETRSVRVGAFDYPIQKLTLPPHLVELSPEDAARVNRENAEVAKILDRGGPRRFELPLADPLSPLPKGGRFGNRRIINGKPRSPHGGADYAAETGVPVLSAGDGTVALVADHLLPGRCVFVDHGDSLVTMYFHLSRVDVEQGQPVKRGERIGAVGATGRVTGAHLHFGVRWRKARVDPALLLGRPEALPSVD